MSAHNAQKKPNLSPFKHHRNLRLEDDMFDSMVECPVKTKHLRERIALDSGVVDHAVDGAGVAYK